MHGLVSHLFEQNLIHLCPLWLLTPLFLSMVVLITEAKSCSLQTPQGSMYATKLRQLMFIMKGVSHVWVPANWVNELFERCLDSLERKSLPAAEPGPDLGWVQDESKDSGTTFGPVPKDDPWSELGGLFAFEETFTCEL